jgi:hypothetical protein
VCEYNSLGQVASYQGEQIASGLAAAIRVLPTATTHTLKCLRRTDWLMTVRFFYLGAEQRVLLLDVSRHCPYAIVNGSVRPVTGSLFLRSAISVFG